MGLCNDKMLLLLLVLLLLLSAVVAAGPGCVFRVSSACLPRVICVTGLIDWASVSPTVSTGMEDATILGNTTLYAAFPMQKVIAMIRDVNIHQRTSSA